MDSRFVSYAFQDLPHKRIVKYARQYAGIDMAALLGADEDNFPFLVRVGTDRFAIMVWNTYNGMLECTDEDSVRAFATVEYLRENAYPVFDSLGDAEKWATEHSWPRKPRPSV